MSYKQFDIQPYGKSKLAIWVGLLFLFLGLSLFSVPLFSGLSELPGKTFTFPGLPEEVFQATLDALKIESIPVADQNQKEGFIRTVEFPIPKSEFKKWANSRMTFRKGYVMIHFKVLKKGDRLSLLEIAPEFRKNPRLTLNLSTKYVSSKGYFEELLAARIYALFIAQKYPEIFQLAIGCVFEQDEEMLVYRIGEIRPRSFGEEQGFKEGDFLLEIDGVRITVENLFEILTGIHENTKKVFKLERDGKTIELDVDVFVLNSDLPWVGFRVERDERNGDFYVAEVMKNSPASEAGLRAGDRLIEEEGVFFDSWKNYYQIVTSTKPDRERLLVIHRAGKRTKLTVKPLRFVPPSEEAKKTS